MVRAASALDKRLQRRP